MFDTRGITVMEGNVLRQALRQYLSQPTATSQRRAAANNMLRSLGAGVGCEVPRSSALTQTDAVARGTISDAGADTYSHLGGCG